MADTSRDVRHAGRRVSLQSVASEAGVSLATASRVINGATSVNEVSRDRVLAAAERMGYRLNIAAHATARGTVPIVAVVVDDLRSPFSAELAKGVIDAASGWGLVATVTGGASNPGGLSAIVHGLRGQRPRAIIMAATAMQNRSDESALVAELKAYEASGGRVVFVNGAALPFASCDLGEAEAGSRLAALLVAQGYVRPLVLGGPSDRRDLDARLEGLLHGFAALGEPARYLRADPDRAGGARAIRALTDEDLVSLDLIACVDDSQALGVMKELRRRSLPVPSAVSVTGFGDLPGSTDVRPMLTTVGIPYGQLGRTLLALALESSGVSRRSLELRIQVRESAEVPRDSQPTPPELLAMNAPHREADLPVSQPSPLGGREDAPRKVKQGSAAAEATRSVTIADVAGLARVSTASVSRVLNGVSTVRPEIAARVSDAVKQLGYAPNNAARSLSRGTTKTIGVLVPDLSNPMFQQLLVGVNSAAAAAGYRVQIADTREDAAGEARAALEARKTTDAIILCAPRMGREELQASVARLAPCVVINGDVPDDLPHVGVDYAAGVRLLAAHLWSLGHRHIAYLGGPSGSYAQTQRENGLREFEDAHPDVRIDRFPCGSGIDDGYEAWDRIQVTAATAVLAFNDLVALGLLGRLKEERVTVPDDLSVAGFDNVPLSRFASPALTTVEVSYERVGESAWDALGMLSDIETDRSRPAFDPRLIRRASTDAPPRGARG